MNQFLVDQWTFSKYDELNRLLMTGIYNHTENATQQQMQALADAHSITNETHGSLKQTLKTYLTG